MSELLNKKALVDIVANQMGMTKKAAGETVDLIFDEITSTLKDGGKVDISGFGKFDLRTGRRHPPEGRFLLPGPL